MVPLFSTQHLKGNTGCFFKNFDRKKRNGYNLGWKSSMSKVIGHCGGDEKTNHHAELTESNAKITTTNLKCLS